MTKDSSQKSSYQGLSRTYRPQTFASVIGQEAIVTTLKNAIRLQKTAQAYLFCGTRGTGKTTLARVLAKALNCQNLSLEDGEPCGTCDSCLEISQGKSLNILEIDGASNRGIDDIRGLNETVNYAPSRGGFKIFIIDEAHMLTKEAFNALLKTLEEPPPNVKFFLATTEAHKIPPTILSRCQRFDLKRIPSSKILQKLIQIAKDQGVDYEEEALHIIASLSDGSMRVAESLLDQIFCFSTGALTAAQVASSLAILPSDSFFELDEAFHQYNLFFAFEWAGTIFSSGKDLSYFLDCLLEHYRNILVLLMKLPLEEFPLSLKLKYERSATLYTQEQALYILDYLIEWHQHVNKTPFKRISLEMILLHILKSKYRVSPADLVCRLQELQKGVPAPLAEPPMPKPQTAPLLKEQEPVLVHNEIKKPLEVQAAPEAPIKNQVQKEEPILAPVEKAEIKQPQEKEENWIEQELMPSLPSDIPALATPSVQPVSTNNNHQIKQETLMRFAAVELEGLLTKES